jgi:hypothetical protein
MIFSLLHATKGRPEKAFETMNRWIGMSSGDHHIEYIFSLDDDDHNTISKMKMVNAKVIIGKNRGNVDAYNAAAKISTGDILIQVHDDLLCPVNWDILVARYLPNPLEKKVLHVSDGRNDINQTKPDLITLNLCTRAWYETRRYFWYPEYVSIWCDDDLTDVARSKNAIIDVRDRLTFFHAWQGASADKTYADSYTEANWKAGEAIYNRRKVEGFPEWT